MALPKTSAILLKYPTFEGAFFMFSWANVRTKKLSYIKVTKRSNGFRFPFYWIDQRLNTNDEALKKDLVFRN